MRKLDIDTVLSIHEWLTLDAMNNHSDRETRDAALKSACSGRTPVSAVLVWWSHVNPATRSRVVNGIAWITRVLFALGALVGVSLTSFVLAYRGDHPVNLLVLLGLMVGIPTLTLLLSLSKGTLRYLNVVPPFRLSQSTFSHLNRLTDLDIDLLRQAKGRYTTLGYWMLQNAIQMFSIGFFIAASVTFLITIALSDVAFGWSTTLDLDAGWLHAITSFLSWPWQHAWAEASPSLSLIEESQFYRLGEVSDPARLGQWWPFIIMVIALWGLLPRIVFKALCTIIVRRHLKATLLNHPEVTALIDRLTSPLVQHTHDPLGTAPDFPDPVSANTESSDLAHSVTLSWNNADSSDLQISALKRVDDIADAVADDTTHLIIKTKGWEPPLLEFNDFLAAIRHQYPAVTIVVDPLGMEKTPLSDTDLNTWRATIAKLQDAKVYVQKQSAEVGAE
ncbi:MAG: DUF2868 domain-containing protein [Pseudomonadota bacterium]